jgi:hypothetical protein
MNMNGILSRGFVAILMALLFIGPGSADPLLVRPAGFLNREGVVVPVDESAAVPESIEGTPLAEYIAQLRRKPRIDLGLQSVMTNENFELTSQAVPGARVYLLALFQDQLQALTPCRRIQGRKVTPSIRLRGVLTSGGWVIGNPGSAQCDWIAVVWTLDVPREASAGSFSVSHRVKIRGYRVQHGRATAAFTLAASQ